MMQLVPALESGGVERGAVEVSEALCRRGHRSIVVSGGGRLVERIEAHGGEHFRLNLYRKSPSTLASAARLKRLISEHRPDVLHARSRVPAWVGLLTLKLVKASVRPAWVTTVHGLYSVSRYSRVMTSGQIVEVVSQTTHDYTLRHYPGTDPQKLFLNHRGVDPDAFPYGYAPPSDWIRAWRSQYPELGGRFVVALAGRLTRLKGHHDLFEAIGRLRERGVDAHGLVVGDEDPRRAGYARELKQAAAQNRLDGAITFTGHRADIKQVLAVSDAVVSLSSKPESFGRSVLEAVRLGRPVVGYDHGGVGEVLRATYPAGLTPRGDIDGLTDRLASLAQGRTSAPAPSDDFKLSDMLDRSLRLYLRAASYKGS